MARRLAFAFPGQGSQRRGMLAPVLGVEGFEPLLAAAEALTALPLRQLAEDGTDEELADTRVAQPLLYLTDLAWAFALSAKGVAPELVAGHSLGELAALAFAGVFSAEDGLELVVTRSRLMAAAADGESGMAAILGMSAADVACAVEGVPGVWVANDNAPGQVVLSGTRQGLMEAGMNLQSIGTPKVVPLKVAAAFHSPLMAEAAEAFRAVLSAIELAHARVPVVQNADPRPTSDPEVICERLAAQMVNPVRWTETMLAFRLAGIDTIVECGPGGVLRGLARRVEGLTALSAEDRGVDAVIEEVS